MTKRWSVAAMVTLAGAALLWRPQAVAAGISRGLSICSNVLIPSVFPFLVLCGIVVRVGLAAALGRRLEHPTRRIFGLPGCCAAAIVIGFVGGYPAGGAAVGDLVRSGQISRDEGKRLLRFCVNGGPGFVIGTVGAVLMGSTAIGAVILLANTLASLLLGVLGVPKDKRRQPPIRQTSAAAQPLSVALVESVTSACEALLSMCGFVLLFSAVTALVEVSGITALLGKTPSGTRLLSALLASVLEVSCGCTAAASLGSYAAFFLAFAVGFGGLSVHCQLAAALRDVRLIDGTFFVTRLAQGSLTAVLTVVLLRFIPITLPVWGAWQQPVAAAMGVGSVTLSVALLVLGGVWMLTVGSHKTA